MSKQVFVDPGEMRAPGTIALMDIPVNRKRPSSPSPPGS